MLRRDDRLDDVGNIVYIRQGFYAKEDVVKRLLGRMGGIFGSADDSMGLEPLVAVELGFEGYAVLGNALVSRLPYEGDVAGICCLQSP
jgi:hypothetical protein